MLTIFIINFFIRLYSDYHTFKVDKNKSSPTYGEAYAPKRRQTLFNLYAFTFTDSFQKNVSASGSIAVEKNYQIPSLQLRNVEVRNFLYDYQSLIHVEKDNYVVGVPELASAKPGTDDTKELHLYHFGNFEADAKIQIEGSKFVDSSFSQGMIFFPPNCA